MFVADILDKSSLFDDSSKSSFFCESFKSILNINRDDDLLDSSLRTKSSFLFVA